MKKSTNTTDPLPSRGRGAARRRGNPDTKMKNSSNTADPSPPRSRGTAWKRGNTGTKVKNSSSTADPSLSRRRGAVQKPRGAAKNKRNRGQPSLEPTNEQVDAHKPLRKGALNAFIKSKIPWKVDYNANHAVPPLPEPKKYDIYAGAPYLKPGKHGSGGDFKDDETRGTGKGHQVEPADAKLRDEYSSFVQRFRQYYMRNEFLPDGQRGMRRKVWIDWEIVPEPKKAEYREKELWLMNFAYKYAGHLNRQWRCGCEILSYDNGDESEAGEGNDSAREEAPEEEDANKEDPSEEDEPEEY